MKETRNFAGKQMEVVKTYESGSREAKAAAKRESADEAARAKVAVAQQAEVAKARRRAEEARRVWDEATEAFKKKVKDREKITIDV